MPALRARRKYGSIGASVFHGAVMRSPFPAWQWQSTIKPASLAAIFCRFDSHVFATALPQPCTRCWFQFRERRSGGETFHSERECDRRAARSPSIPSEFRESFETCLLPGWIRPTAKRLAARQILSDKRTPPLLTQDDCD